MDLVFMSAALPLTKTFVFKNDQYAVSPYPQVSKLTSHHEQPTTLAEFETTLRTHSLRGHCLFNGALQRPIVDESRAGLTRKGSDRHWLVFDFDKVPGTSHVDIVSRFLPAECQNVSYIVQHSASMWRTDTTKWSGHIYMLLATPSHEADLRRYFEYLNFTIPALKEALCLTDSGMGLHWPLDRSAAYDSKLIYIAPPRCRGFKPTLDESTAIALVKKRNPALKIPAFTPIDRSHMDDLVHTLRERKGLPRLNLATKPFEDGEIMMQAEGGYITDVRPMGGHYIKFNLNGGDSLGYWIDLNNPSIIKNFKGEPWLMTEQVDPEFYDSLRRQAKKAVGKPPLNAGASVFAFYATNHDSRITIGLHDPMANELRLNQANETSARAWLAEFGCFEKKSLPHLDIVFDPQTDVVYVPGMQQINTFKPSPYMAQGKQKIFPSALNEIPRTIDRVLRSLLGAPSDQVYRHFVNWLAYIFTTRQKSQTAWVFSGRTGTGKGSFIRFILRPLFGNQNVHTEQFTALGHQFNGFLENKLFVVFEEADTRIVPNSAELMAKLRHWITDSPISIRRMGVDHYDAPSYTNFILMANERTSVAVTGDDRRFNFAERQETKLDFTANEMMILHSGAELEAFADVLHRWPVDEVAVTQIVETQTRKDVHEATTSINGLIAEAVMRGDLQWLIDHMPSEQENLSDIRGGVSLLKYYKQCIDEWVTAARIKKPILVREEQLFTIFRTLIPDPRYFQDSPTWRKRHYKSLGLDLDKQVRIPGKWGERARGLLIDWRMPEIIPDGTFVMPVEQHETVVPIRRPRGRPRKET